VEVVASLSQGRTAAAKCGFFTYKSVPVIFEPPCTTYMPPNKSQLHYNKMPHSKRSQLNCIENVSRRISKEGINKTDLTEEDRQTIVNR